MTRRLPLAFIVAASMTAYATAGARAGAWTQEPGRAHLRETISFYRATRYLDDDGKSHPGDWLDPSTEFSNTRFLHVGEYGLREGLTVTTELLYQDLRAARTGEPSQTLSGFGDFKVGLKKRIVEGHFAFSVLGQVGIPTGYEADVPVARQDDQGSFYTLGSGRFSFELGALLSGEFRLGWMSGTYDVRAGYNARGGAYANDATYGAALALNPFWRLWLGAALDGVENLHTADKVATMTNEQKYNSPSYTSARVAASVEVTRVLSIEVGYRADLRGSNTFKGSAIEVGFEVRR